MTIYVVKPGDSLWLISNRYGVTTQSIIDANGISNQPYLVVGQSLVIPTQETVYTVKPGDTLWSLSIKFNVPAGSIAALNQIVSPFVIYPGMVLRIPQKAKNYGYIEVNGYIEPSTSTAEKGIVDETGPYLTYISPFSYQINADGTINPINDTTILQTAKQYKIGPLMVITNFRNGNFDTQLADALLKSDTAQQNLINNVLTIMKNKGYYGLNIDFERVLPADRQLYNNFLRKVVPQLHKENYVVSTALAPKTSDLMTGAWYGAHDYRAHGEIVDFVILMTYEWGWSGGPPYAVAPINLVKQVLDYAVSVIPRKKIMMGMPTYGYDWTLPYIPGGPFAKRVSQIEAVTLAAQHGVAILYDEKLQSPHFNYTTSDGTRHEVWFEDARSVEAKLKLASAMGLRGVSYWTLGVPFPQNWQVLDNMFNIVKVIR